MYLIEGLADGRYGLYMKMHHALADGVGAMRLLRRALSSDPDEVGNAGAVGGPGHLGPAALGRRYRHRDAEHRDARCRAE